MRPVSESFLRTLTGSHQMCARARIVEGHPVGTDPDGTEVLILDGAVKLDANAEVRGALDLTVDGTGRWPTARNHLLSPYGAEIYVERGVVLGDGTREWVSQGYYRINDVEQDKIPDGPIRITGLDRMAGVRDARLIAPIQFNAGTSVELVFETLVLDLYPLTTLLFDFNAAATTFNVSHVIEEDRYAFLNDLARSYGKVMYFNHEGDMVVATPPNPESPVWEVASGEHGVLVSMSRQLSRQGVYNAVVASGEAPGEGDPVRAVARDLNPESPTYWLGAFGQVPRFYSSSFITTTDQAGDAAEQMLRRALGLPYNVNFNAVPNPALEPLDPIRLSHPAGSEIHVVESVALSLTVRDAMSVTTREQTSENIDVGED